MMERKLLLFLILFTAKINSQNYSWGYTVKGAYMPVKQTVIDQNNNVYALGTGSLINHSGGAQQMSSCSDFFTKYRPDGTLEWTIPINDDSVNYYCRKIEINSNGEILLAGSRDGKIILKKVNNTGTIVWSKTFAVPQALSANLGALTTDSNNNIIVAGQFATTVCGYCSPPTDLFIYKIDNAGNLVWSRNFIKNDGFMNVLDVKCDANDDIVLCGAGSNLNFQGNINQYTLTPGNFLTKYSSAGEPMWAKSMASNLKETSLACDGTDIYAAGSFDGQINMDGQIYNAAPQGSACLYKVNSNGTICWTKTLGDVYAKFSSIQLNKVDHSIWLSGGYSSQLNISTQSGTYSFSSPPYYGYNLDFFVLQSDSSGNWNKINMVETINGQMWGGTSNIQNGKFAVWGQFWGKAVFTKNNNGKDTLCGKPDNISYDGLVAFFGDNTVVTGSNHLFVELNNLLVYPNPSNGQLIIDPEISSKYDLEIYDALGRSVLIETNLSGRKEYSDLNLLPGTYSVRVRSKQVSVETKVIIQ